MFVGDFVVNPVWRVNLICWIRRRPHVYAEFILRLNDNFFTRWRGFIFLLKCTSEVSGVQLYSRGTQCVADDRSYVDVQEFVSVSVFWITRNATYCDHSTEMWYLNSVLVDCGNMYTWNTHGSWKQFPTFNALDRVYVLVRNTWRAIWREFDRWG